MRVRYVRNISYGNGGGRIPKQPSPRWLIIGAIVCALVAGAVFLLAPAVVVLFGVLSGILGLWGIILAVWNLFKK